MAPVILNRATSTSTSADDDVQSKNVWVFWPDNVVSIPNSYTDLTTRPGAIAGIVVGVVGGVLLLLFLITLCLYHLGAADFISTRYGSSERSSDIEASREKPRHLRRRRSSVGRRYRPSRERSYGRRRSRSRSTSSERRSRSTPTTYVEDEISEGAAPSPVVYSRPPPARRSSSRRRSRERGIPATAYRSSSAGPRRASYHDGVRRVSSRSRSRSRSRGDTQDEYDYTESEDPRMINVNEGTRLHGPAPPLPHVYAEDEAPPPPPRERSGLINAVRNVLY